MRSWFSCCRVNARQGRDASVEENPDDKGCTEVTIPEVAGCVERDGKQSVDWQYVGDGNGSYVQSPEYDYVGDGYGTYAPQKVITYHGWKFRKPCIYVGGVLAVGGAIGLLALIVVQVNNHTSETGQEGSEFVGTQAGETTKPPRGLPLFNCDNAGHMSNLKSEYCCEKFNTLCDAVVSDAAPMQAAAVATVAPTAAANAFAAYSPAVPAAGTVMGFSEPGTAAPRQAISGSCAEFGCALQYSPMHDCQCNAGCDAHANCCNDQASLCG